MSMYLRKTVGFWINFRTFESSTTLQEKPSVTIRTRILPVPVLKNRNPPPVTEPQPEQPEPQPQPEQPVPQPHPEQPEPWPQEPRRRSSTTTTVEITMQTLEEPTTEENIVLENCPVISPNENLYEDAKKVVFEVCR